MIRIARPKARSLAIVALPVVAVAITVPTVAMAVDPEPATVFKGCLFDGEISRVTTGTAPTCTGMGPLSLGTGEAVSWNQQGPVGVTGAAGAAGAAGTQGVAGVAGTVGAQGPAGKNGVAGYRMVATQTKAKARTAATYTVKCKDGRYALGGGMNGTSDLVLNGSGPTPDAKGWIVRVTNVATKNRTIQVYVTCAFAS
ncbi:hypothetical protein [Sporichthya sp.]|uniref:hypothetical protein n=1 Tax=Sporichthya sp. TaxID=65475 RepID=UPI0017E28FD3|nr:hypothetical protein [Sporichthya sp.]MBA3742925.1 hypothetical protein [Sporichthya sp.]